MNVAGLQKDSQPFDHWTCEDFLTPATVQEINRTWPTDGHWYIELAGYARKSALMFPQRLNDAAQEVAEQLYSPEVCAELSSYVGFELLPDPWFTEGPLNPRLGGGLHEIGPGGLLKIHVDFDIHPTGLQRAANLLIYLNEDWTPYWGGQLELHGTSVKKIVPLGGTAVFFVTDGYSWHGHPNPLACPQDRARRSLALYYYRKPEAAGERLTTVYRK